MRHLLLLVILSISAFAQLDTTKWYAVDIKDNGTFCRQSSQVAVSGGYLTLTEDSGSYTCAPGGTGVPYTTGMIVSTPFSFTYGVVKARARLGSPGNSLWNAIWMWGGGATSSGYPATCIAAIKAQSGTTMDLCTNTSVLSYEIDIAENQSSSNQVRQNVISWNNGAKTNISGHTTTLTGDSVITDFHIYELDWFPTVLVFKVDNTIVSTVVTTFSVPMFLIIDNELNGPATSYPATTTVDWIRVCSDPNAICNPGDPTMIFQDEFGPIPPTPPTSKALQGISSQGITEQ